MSDGFTINPKTRLEGVLMRGIIAVVSLRALKGAGADKFYVFGW